MIYLAKFSSTAVGTGHIVQYTRTVTAVLKENNVHLGIQKDIKEGCKRMPQGQKSNMKVAWLIEISTTVNILIEGVLLSPYLSIALT